MEFLKRFLLWFLAGSGAAAGVLATIAAYELLWPRRSHVREVEIPSQSLRLTNIRQAEIATYLTFVGNIENTSGKPLGAASIRVAILKDGKVVFECEDSAAAIFKSSGADTFQVACKQIERRDVPASVEFKLSVTWARAA